MAAKGGKDFLLRAESAPNSGTYLDLGGLRSTTLAGAAESIDVTNHGSNEWREILDGAGIRQYDISGSGVYTNAAILTTVEDAFLANQQMRFQIVDLDAGRTYTGKFKIPSFERTGDYNNEQAYSISLESSGEVVIS